jgi:hypothetical protein
MSFERNLRVAAIVICASVPFAGSAVAAPMIPAKAVRAETGPVVDVRWRGNRWHDGRYRHYGWRHRYPHRYGWGPAVGGLAAGAVIGGAIANSRAQALESDAYCSQRFKSYDPRSGTYLGYDGQRHPCP